MLLEEMMRNERQEGNTEGKQEFLLAALESKFSVPSELKEKIMSETDIEKLNLWFKLIVLPIIFLWLNCYISFKFDYRQVRQIFTISAGEEKS